MNGSSDTLNDKCELIKPCKLQKDLFPHMEEEVDIPADGCLYIGEKKVLIENTLVVPLLIFWPEHDTA